MTELSQKNSDLKQKIEKSLSDMTASKHDHEAKVKLLELNLESQKKSSLGLLNDERDNWERRF